MVKIKVIRDIVEEMTLANEPYVRTQEEQALHNAWWLSVQRVCLTRGVNEHGEKWFRVTKYDRAADRRLVLDSEHGWVEYGMGSAFIPATQVFCEEN